MSFTGDPWKYFRINVHLDGEIFWQCESCGQTSLIAFVHTDYMRLDYWNHLKLEHQLYNRPQWVRGITTLQRDCSDKG